MKTTATSVKFQVAWDGKPEVTLRLSAPMSEVRLWHEELKDLTEMDVEVKKHRNRRSLDSNAYLWVLCSKLAAVLRTSKDEVYLTMLERYGVFTHIIVKPQIVARVKAEWRTVKELGEVTIGGQKGIQLQCYFGSHTYDSKEMGVLIDGIVSECKELDIETLSPAELERMKNEWGKEG